MSNKSTTQHHIHKGGPPMNIHYYCYKCDTWVQPALTRQGLPHIEATPGDKMAEYRAFLLCGHVVRLGQTKLRNADGNQFDVVMGMWRASKNPLVLKGTHWIDPTEIPYPQSPIGHYAPESDDLPDNVTQEMVDAEYGEITEPVEEAL